MGEARPLCLSGPYCPRIDGAGHGRREPGTVRRRPICDYLLTTLRTGSGSFDLDGATRPVAAGTTWIVPPGRPFTARFDGVVELSFVHCSPIHDPAWAAFAHRNLFDVERGGRSRFLQPEARAIWGVELPALVPRRLAARFARELPALVEQWCSGGAAATFAANTRLAALLATLVEALPAGAAADTDLAPSERIAMAETMARRRCGIGLAVDDLAEAAGYTRTHFTEIFARLRGETPGAFLRRLILEEACSRLQISDEPVAGIAHELGFADGATFARAFRRAFDATPAAWRQRHAR